VTQAISNERGERTVLAGTYDIWFKHGTERLLRAPPMEVTGAARVVESYAHLAQKMQALKRDD